jgi:hypothetical protein
MHEEEHMHREWGRRRDEMGVREGIYLMLAFQVGIWQVAGGS